MSFIFGIINLDGTSVVQQEIDNLANAVKWENFTVQSEIESNIGIGYCSYPGRNYKAGIYKSKELIVLSDIRIYNEEHLKKFITYTSPEEAFAKAYLLWDIECANHINGDFACVVIDKRKQEVHSFRDHIGTRPLVYWNKGSRIVFASHEFGLAKSGLIKTTLCEEKLIHRFFKMNNIYEQTVFQNVKKVIPGYCISFSHNHKIQRKYWYPEKINQNKNLSFDKAVSRLRQLLISATTNRIEMGMMGTHVSGGLDSTGIASILADHIEDKSNLYGYSWTPETFNELEKGENEKEYIEAFSNEKKISVWYQQLINNEFVKDSIIPEFETQHIEHPTMKMAKEDKVVSLFSGWGGDEFVSSGNRGTVNHLFFKFKWLEILRYCKTQGIRLTIRQFRIEVFPQLIPFGLLPTSKIQFSNWSKLLLLKPGYICKYWKLLFCNYRKRVMGYGGRSQFKLGLLQNYHIPERMDSWAINAEKYGFEYKYPLLDKDLLEFWFSIPVEFTYKDFSPRLLYREALKGILTEEIRLRKDKGEALRLTYSLNELLDGKKYLEQLFYSLTEQDHLPFFNPKAFYKVIKQPTSQKPIKNWIKLNKLTFYLRYVNLVKEYMNATNTQSIINPE